MNFRAFFRRMGDRFRFILSDEDNVNLIESTPLLSVHLACLGIFWVGVSRIAVAACVVTYFVRVFALTAGYHRYFSHNSYKTSRAFQFILAFMGGSAAQLGPLWWAAHHRYHHLHADTDKDVHSPKRDGFLWSHLGWLMCRKYAKAELDRVRDISKYPEIRFLDRFHIIPPFLLAFGLYWLGEGLAVWAPLWHTSGWQLVIWGFFVSTVFVYHATFCINSLTHMIGTRRFNTPDESRNNFWLALITFGEGWHNNHHRYPIATRQGFYWWEVDITYYLLKMLSFFHIVWDLREPPSKLYEEARLIAARPSSDPVAAS